MLVLIFCLVFTPADNPPVSFGEAQISGKVSRKPLDEASGLVAGRLNKDVLWTHNDSGDSNRIFAISTSGRLLGTFVLEGAGAIDYEDIAAGPGPRHGLSYLYVADTGNNGAHTGRPRENVVVYRVPEPDLQKPNPSGILQEVDPLVLTYPKEAHDVETLLVDPRQGDLYLVTKRDEKSRIYHAPSPGPGEQHISLKFVGEMFLTTSVGGDISADGSLVLIKTYDEIYVYQRSSHTSLVDCLTQPRPPKLVHYKPEPQGESIAFDSAGEGFYTLSEARKRKQVPLYFFPRIKP